MYCLSVGGLGALSPGRGRVLHPAVTGWGHFPAVAGGVTGRLAGGAGADSLTSLPGGVRVAPVRGGRATAGRSHDGWTGRPAAAMRLRYRC
ncbi:hypothetical protein H180DRAFT_02492 [Streptomyces sp. WMMB 322]|nr:hypothetical protein H180DRAFT_02492 [Streptomyces sp. WMMB 322]